MLHWTRAHYWPAAAAGGCARAMLCRYVVDGRAASGGRGAARESLAALIDDPAPIPWGLITL